MKKILILSAFVLGLTAMASQIVLVREFLSIFYGNELSIGFVLLNWLLGGALGGIILARAADRAGRGIFLLWLCQVLIAIILPLEIFGTRILRLLLKINPGELIPYTSMIWSVFLVLLPLCALMSFLFALICRMLKDISSGTGASEVAKVYALESLGAAAGGIVTSFILIGTIGAFYSIILLSFLNIIVSLFSAISSRTALRYAISGISALFVALYAVMLFTQVWPQLDRHSLYLKWKGEELIAAKDSIYGNIAVTQRAGQFSFFDNGLYLYALPDKMSAEESVHFALLEHPNPKTLLLIGGGPGALEEALKNDVEKIDYIELDPAIITMAEEILPKKYLSGFVDPKVKIITGDARFIIRNGRNRYDCIIMCAGEPYTALLNRFYTREFYLEVKSRMSAGGVFSFALPSSESFLTADARSLLNSVYCTLSQVFDDIVTIPGQTAHFAASNRKGFLTYDYRILMQRAAQRDIKAEYIREYYLSSRMSEEKIAYLRGALEGERGRINTDFKPVAYYYDIRFWSSRFRDSFISKFLKGLGEGAIWDSLAVFMFLILVILLIAVKKGADLFRCSVRASLISLGATGLSVQIIILIAFQIIYGFLYYKLGIILTSFMAGTALGAYASSRIVANARYRTSTLLYSQLAMSIVPITLPIFFALLDNNMRLYWLGSNFLFLLFPLACGFLGGFQFPIANSILVIGGATAASAGTNYGLDLLGASIGALLTSAILVPLLGIPMTSYFTSALNFAVLIVIIFSAKPETMEAQG